MNTPSPVSSATLARPRPMTHRNAVALANDLNDPSRSNLGYLLFPLLLFPVHKISDDPGDSKRPSYTTPDAPSDGSSMRFTS
jgi:hypothetical protein